MPRAKLTAKEMAEQAAVAKWLRANIDDAAERIAENLKWTPADGYYSPVRDHTGLLEKAADLLNEQFPIEDEPHPQDEQLGEFYGGLRGALT